MRLRHMDWVRMVWEETEGIPLDTVRIVMRKAMNILVREIVKGRTITIRSLGTLSVYQRPARKFYNPAKKEFVDKPVTALPRFKFSSWLKDQVTTNGREA